ncbi:DUF2020 domain-containing protein [Corynebacterium alimapuense]|uniref:DUF2020 domain-containing protein n=1 Tax=Corynebacterium alimapuense TaxID=1576874 RepID=A0A3M8KA00_9CORY|nr:DUF2020 domain-containing protein [Corynebacterium alimapuense]RNE50041.1 DUF2020 domain-containing protein [Corynebacterium alimapuense]
MRSSLPSAIAAPVIGAVLLLTGCSTAMEDGISATEEISAEAASDPLADPATEPVADSGLPVNALPEIPGGRSSTDQCPYLDNTWVAETNGQITTGTGIDLRFDTPACVFWSYPEDPQLTVIIREMPDRQSAIEVVDWAAPIDYTEPAEEIEGWSGGRAGAGMVPEGLPTGQDGALYAVQKDNRAVVVFSNQDQSLKAELVAREVINNLGW